MAVQCIASHRMMNVTYCSKTEIIFSATRRMSIKSRACKHGENVQLGGNERGVSTEYAQSDGWKSDAERSTRGSEITSR